MRTLLVTVALVILASTAWAADRPNIILVMADDMGVGDVSAMRASSRSVLHTPYMDAIAERGVVFENARSVASVCTPTRYGVLTGQLLRRSWLGQGIVKPYGSTVITDEWTLAKFLRREGYATSWVGKSHLGFDWYTKTGDVAAPHQRQRDWRDLDFSRPYARGPVDFGFDRYFGVDAPNYPPYAYIRNDHIVGSLTSWKGPEQFGTDGLAVPGWDVSTVFRTLRREALRELNRLSRGDKPFFLYLPLTAPHHPITPSPWFQGRSGIGPYGDFVLEIDFHVGEIVRDLRRYGLQDDTIIIVTSDNGSPAAIDSNSEPTSLLPIHRANGDLRGIKAGPYEGGLRIPLIISWPREGRAGVRTDEVVSLIDLAPTIADLIGRPLRSPNAAPDANSFADLIVDGMSVRRQRMDDWGEYGESLAGIPTLRHGPWKLVERDEGPELYNLRDDPGERDNLAETNPGALWNMRSTMGAYWPAP